ncbi:hypothetical protein [Spiroplasma endosymbiont of Aspidapion aeneum]|uniref:hypothetical protein n=1 Tax=Spiroplasma endosymbiont of Aspidapion aeneum TaxID=3066276 RepID=UPI00313EA555
MKNIILKNNNIDKINIPEDFIEFSDLVQLKKIIFQYNADTRFHIFGYNLYNCFIELIRYKKFVVTYVNSICDTIETILFSDANVFLYELREISIDKSMSLYKNVILQKERVKDDYHDIYVNEYHSFGKDDEK